MPRVVINGRFLTQAVTGVQRVGCEVLRALDDLIQQNEIDGRHYQFSLAVPPGCEPDLQPRHIPIEIVGRPGIKGQVWEQTALARHQPRALLLSMGNVGPLFRSNQVVVIHDASVYAVPSAYSLAFRSWYRFVLRRLGRSVQRVITPSHFSSTELVRRAGLPPDRLRVVALGADHLNAIEPDNSVFVRRRVGPEPYILAVSTAAPHKNLEAALQALLHLRKIVPELELVGVGGSFPAIFASDSSRLPQMHRIGYVSDAELKALYQRAQCFVFPSWYEGFGLPPLEAMAVGCPVVVSRAASLPEVCADAALYCDPHDPSSVAEAVGRVLADPTLGDHLRAVGRSHAARFSWRDTARGVFATVAEVLG